MTKRFGLDELGSIEVFFEDAWFVQAFSGASRSGRPGSSVATATDDALAVAALSTVPVFLANDGYETTGDWHMDEDRHSAWINVVPSTPEGGSTQPSHTSVDAILDAEVRWERLGVGRQTPRA
jgi:hypothetical protein